MNIFFYSKATIIWVIACIRVISHTEVVSALDGTNLSAVKLHSIAAHRDWGYMRLCFCGGMPWEEATLRLITGKCLTSNNPNNVWVSLFNLLWDRKWLKNRCMLLVLGLRLRDGRFRSVLSPLSDRTHRISLSIYRLSKWGLCIIGGSRRYLLCLNNKMLLFWRCLLPRWAHAFPMLTMMRFRNLYLLSCCYGTVKCSLLFQKALVIRNHQVLLQYRISEEKSFIIVRSCRGVILNELWLRYAVFKWLLWRYRWLQVSPLIPSVHHPLLIELRSLSCSQASADHSCTWVSLENLLPVCVFDTALDLPDWCSVLLWRLTQEGINDIIAIGTLNCEGWGCHCHWDWNIPVLIQSLLPWFHVLAPCACDMGEWWPLISGSNGNSGGRSYFNALSWHFHKLIDYQTILI